MPPVRVSPFATRVYAATRQIPRGRVTTYRELARHLKCRSARAIGQALRHNPFAPQVPCHRVIRADLSIGGFMGKTSGLTLAKKIALLHAEGVHFRNGHLQDPSQVFEFTTCSVSTKSYLKQL